MGTELVCLQVCSFPLPWPWAVLFKTSSACPVLNSVADNFRIAILNPVASSQVDVQRGAFLDKDSSECHSLLETKPTEAKRTNFALLCTAPFQHSFSGGTCKFLLQDTMFSFFWHCLPEHWWMEQETICLFLCTTVTYGETMGLTNDMWLFLALARDRKGRKKLQC